MEYFLSRETIEKLALKFRKKFDNRCDLVYNYYIKGKGEKRDRRPHNE